VLNNDSVHYLQYAQYTYRTAYVIHNSVTAGNNFITLNRGRKDGIAQDMAVISGTGIVGKVVQVSAHFATVRSVLSINQQVSAKLKDGTFSFVSWEGGNPDVLLMKNIPTEIKVKNGDSVFTTSFSTLFPPNVLVGTVFKIAIQKKDNTQQLFLRSATNFRNLQYVYVIADKMQAERQELEEATKNKK
jgi:rod shape-determining protein MreC